MVQAKDHLNLAAFSCNLWAVGNPARTVKEKARFMSGKLTGCLNCHCTGYVSGLINEEVRCPVCKGWGHFQITYQIIVNGDHFALRFNPMGFVQTRIKNLAELRREVKFAREQGIVRQ